MHKKYITLCCKSQDISCGIRRLGKIRCKFGSRIARDGGNWSCLGMRIRIRRKPKTATVLARLLSVDAAALGYWRSLAVKSESTVGCGGGCTGNRYGWFKGQGGGVRSR